MQIGQVVDVYQRLISKRDHVIIYVVEDWLEEPKHQLPKFEIAEAVWFAGRVARQVDNLHRGCDGGLVDIIAPYEIRPCELKKTNSFVLIRLSVLAYFVFLMNVPAAHDTPQPKLSIPRHTCGTCKCRRQLRAVFFAANETK